MLKYFITLLIYTSMAHSVNTIRSLFYLLKKILKLVRFFSFSWHLFVSYFLWNCVFFVISFFDIIFVFQGFLDTSLFDILFVFLDFPSTLFFDVLFYILSLSDTLLFDILFYCVDFHGVRILHIPAAHSHFPGTLLSDI